MILLGDCLIRLKELEDNSVDAIVTDPPYGLKFMGKKWDYGVPGVEIWRDLFRVIKPGGHLLSFGGTRTYHRMVVNIEDAGFEIRDQIQWLYGSGFPKSHDISKAIDKQLGAKRERYKGWGTALKPANEPVVLARKPLERGLTVAQNMLKWGVGGLNIDASRIDGKPRTTHADGNFKGKQETGSVAFGAGLKDGFQSDNPQGRWPANLLLDAPAAQMLDEQSGTLRARGNKTAKQHVGDYEATSYKFGNQESGYAGDSGGASRFFYVAKASKKERNAGLEGMLEKRHGTYDTTDTGGNKLGRSGKEPTAPQQNHHPTVKPIKLMEYLIRLITPPGGIVLDPFMGSGSTGVAAKRLGFSFIGIEMNEEYCEIAEKRIEAAK